MNNNGSPVQLITRVFYLDIKLHETTTEIENGINKT